jgi:pimeloyl-ACP methyl ester carboxylesterase
MLSKWQPLHFIGRNQNQNMLQLSYNELGAGMPLVLLHGFCESKAIWADFAPSLALHCRVICVDLPGFGESALDKENCSMEAMAEAVAELLSSLQISHCVMIGHSLGGYVALAFAEKHANMLLGLGMFHSTAFADKPEKQENRNKTMAYIQAHGVAAFIKPFVPALFFHTSRKKLEKTIDSTIQIGLQTNIDTILAVTVAMRDRVDRTQVLENLQIPVLYIIGKQDTAVPFEMSLAQIQFPKNCMVQILNHTGHMGMFERKKETLLMIESFCRMV